MDKFQFDDGAFHTMTGQVQLSIIHYIAAAAKGLRAGAAGCRNQGLGGHLRPN